MSSEQPSQWSQAAPFSRRYAKRQTTSRHFTFMKNWDIPGKGAEEERHVITQISPRAHVIISPSKQTSQKYINEDELSDYVRNSPVPVVIQRSTCRSPEKKQRVSTPVEDYDRKDEEYVDEVEAEISVEAQVSNISVTDNELLVSEAVHNSGQQSGTPEQAREDHSVPGMNHSDEKNIGQTINDSLENSHIDSAGVQGSSGGVDDMDSTAAVASDVDIESSDSGSVREEEGIKETPIRTRTAVTENTNSLQKNILRTVTKNPSANRSVTEVDVSETPSGRKRRSVIKVDNKTNSHTVKASDRSPRPGSSETKISFLTETQAKLPPKRSISTRNPSSAKPDSSIQVAAESEEEEESQLSKETKKQGKKLPRKHRADKTAVDTVSLWQLGFNRTKKSVMDLDVVLDTVMQTLKEERDKYEGSLEKKCLKNLCGYISQGITSTIERVEETRSARSMLRMRKTCIKNLRDDLINLQQKRARLSKEKNETKAGNVKKWSISKWLYDFQELMRASQSIKSQPVNRSDAVTYGYLPLLT